MDKELKGYLESFFKISYARLEKGGTDHKNRFGQIDLFEEIVEELADVSNYAFLEYVKIMRLREKHKKYLSDIRDLHASKGA